MIGSDIALSEYIGEKSVRGGGRFLAPGLLVMMLLLKKGEQIIGNYMYVFIDITNDGCYKLEQNITYSSTESDYLQTLATHIWNYSPHIAY